MTKHVMIDLETLGLGPAPVILQIGAVAFDPEADDPIGTTFERTVEIDSCLRSGLQVDGQTLAWWFAQPDAARRAVTTDPWPLANVLVYFYDWIKETTGLAPPVWSHGAAFDVPILEAAYRLCRDVTLPPPWDHRAARDTRTLFWLAEARGWVKPKHETAHTALADAIAQAEDVVSALRAIR